MSHQKYRNEYDFINVLVKMSNFIFILQGNTGLQGERGETGPRVNIAHNEKLSKFL